jgi:hypothetical protein
MPTREPRADAGPAVRRPVPVSTRFRSRAALPRPARVRTGLNRSARHRQQLDRWICGSRPWSVSRPGRRAAGSDSGIGLTRCGPRSAPKPQAVAGAAALGHGGLGRAGGQRSTAGRLRRQDDHVTPGEQARLPARRLAGGVRALRHDVARCGSTSRSCRTPVDITAGMWIHQHARSSDIVCSGSTAHGVPAVLTPAAAQADQKPT